MYGMNRQLPIQRLQHGSEDSLKPSAPDHILCVRREPGSFQISHTSPIRVHHTAEQHISINQLSYFRTSGNLHQLDMSTRGQSKSTRMAHNVREPLIDALSMKRISGAYLHARMDLPSVVVLRGATMISTNAKKVTCFVKSYTTSAACVFEREQAATLVVRRSTRSSCFHVATSGFGCPHGGDKPCTVRECSTSCHRSGAKAERSRFAIRLTTSRTPLTSSTLLGPRIAIRSCARLTHLSCTVPRRPMPHSSGQRRAHHAGCIRHSPCPKAETRLYTRSRWISKVICRRDSSNTANPSGKPTRTSL